MFTRLLDHYPACRNELAYIAQTGPNLAEALTGDADPLRMLFPEGDMTSSAKLYQESTFALVFNTLIQKSVSEVARAVPNGRKIRILEIGREQAEQHRLYLPHLDALQTEYFYTDITPLFLRRASERFQNYSFLQFAALDIEKDPEPQGFAKASFDLIIAANVVHAVCDLKDSLKYIRRPSVSRGPPHHVRGNRSSAFC